MSNVIGLVVQGDQGLNEEFISAIVAGLRPRSVVVINSGKIAERLMPYAEQVICRIKTEDWNDDDFDLNIRDIRAFARKLHNESPAGALLYAGNEPGVRSTLMSATDIFMDECEMLGRRAVIHNWSINFPPDVKQLAMFKPNFERAYAQGHKFGTHDAYFDRHWNTPFLTRFVYLRDTLMAGRFPEVIMTEGGVVYNYDPHAGYRQGPNALSDDAYADELIGQAKALAAHGVSVCLFVMSREYEGNRWRYFIPTERVYDRLIKSPVEWKAYQPVIPTISKPTTGARPGRLVSVPAEFVNIREQPRSSGRDVGDLRPGEAVTYYPDAPHEGWVYVEAAGAAGWVSLQGGAVKFETVDPNAPPFKLAAPVAFLWRYSSRFDAPRDYSQHPGHLQLHEGVDLVPAPGVPGPYKVLAAAAGLVEATGSDPDGYGHYVRIRHDWHGAVYKTWYAHLVAGSIKVAAGQTVEAGAELGQMGSTGYSTGPHLHLTLQAIGKGKSGYVVADVVDPAPYLPDEPAVEPVPDDQPGLVSLVMTLDEAAQFAQWQTRLAELDAERAEQQRQVAAIMARMAILDAERADKQRQVAEMMTQVVARMKGQP